ncbi:MAG: chromosome segregation protein SMC [Phycisphaerae bacterium]
MRLEKIVLNGFKSFADKIEFSFDFPLTAIVGPNGCGKSNVVDAVKWVLGEQSVKSLRSGQMSDVIFGGSSSRKPLASAEVSLFFSNTAGVLPLETDNVQITRRILRSGECEYLINNKVCRLRDVKELFMDTGVGAKAYSIIEQGQVEQLLNASKVDRRAIFEEAAGISKYKAHKKEALRKLERTEQNLLRLADILGEVEKQLRSVKNQAGKARSYLKYTERLKELQVNYSLVEYDKNHTQLTEKNTALQTIQQQFASTAAEVSRCDALMSSLSQQIVETENQVNKTDNNLVSVRSKIEQYLQKIEFLKARIDELGIRKQNASDRVEKLRETKNLYAKDLENYKNEQSQCVKLLAEKNAELEQVKSQIQQLGSDCAALDAELEDEKSGIIDIVRTTAQLHNELQSISNYRNNLSSQKERLNGRANVTQQELEKLLTEKAQYDARFADVQNNLNELTQGLEVQKKKSEKASQLIESDNNRLSRTREALSALNSELGILKDMETRREGLNNSVKEILENRHNISYVEGILADVIAADVNYAAAVEACLEGKTDSLVVSDSKTLISDGERLKNLQGRVSFICLDKIEPFCDQIDLSELSQITTRLVEFVNYQGKYAPLVWMLLGKTLVVDSIDSALELASKLPNQYQFVTRTGELITADGTIKLGPLGKASGLISRKSRIRQLEEIIANMTGETDTIKQQLVENNRTKEHLEKLCKDLRTAVYEANTEKTELHSKLAFYEQNIKRLRQEQPLIAGEIEMLEEQIAQSVKREYASKQRLDELETVSKQRNERIKQLEDNRKTQEAELKNANDKLTELRISMGQIQEQSKALKQTIESLTQQLQANESARQSAQEEIQTCTEQSAQAQREILSSESAVSQLYIDKEQAQRNSSQLHEKIEELLQEQKQNEELLREKRSEQSKIDEQISQLKIELGQLEVRQHDLIERVKEELQIDLVGAYENYQTQDVDWQQVREEINELRGKIERLGNVNIDSIAEQENLEKRQEFLSEQVTDLNSSKNQLQQLITRLNKQSRDKFVETFEQIRANFQVIFRKLFGGGKADIMFEETAPASAEQPAEAKDVLEAGIEIIAKPPGKETRSVSLLSGGEKTMTAIALLFAVFKTKPSPFCFLDEVDAALDEANNERFNIMIREFQKDSQFVMITHSKRTMSIADVLYGVTMQTRGVSKKISVRFDQYQPGKLEAELAAESQSTAAVA